MKTKNLSIETVLFSAFAFAIVLFSAFTISSCGADNPGCNQATATNYDAKADANDGSCRYICDATFWMDSTTVANFATEGVTSLTYFLDGIEVGTSGTTTPYSSAPACGATGTLLIDYDLVKEPSKTAVLVVKNQDDVEVYTTSIEFVGATSGCIFVKVIY